MKKWRRDLWRIAIFLAVALFAGDGFAQGTGKRGVEELTEPGFLAPDFTLPDLNGRPVKLSNFRGKKAVFLNFWASWCPSCQEEMPTMEKLYREFKARGLEIIAVSLDKDRAAVVKFVKRRALTFPVLLDPDFAVAQEYRVTGIPTHYFINKQGVIRSREVGSKDWSKPETWAGIEELLRNLFEHVHALAMDTDGRILFLGAHTGLFRSEDGGRSWRKVALPATHTHLDVMAVAVDPRAPGTIYVGTHEAGVFKSTDRGATWQTTNTGLEGFDVHGLAIDPNEPQKLHAAVREKGEGIYRTTDGGARWTRVDDGPGGEVKVLTSVNIPTGMGGIYLYAGTAEGLQRNPDCF